MKIVVAALAALSLAACASAPVPHARPLNASQIAAMGPTQVAIAEDNNGVAKSWFYQDTSAAGASYGLIGVLVTTTMNVIINYGPSRRAQASADELAAVIAPEELNASLAEQFRQQVSASAPAASVSVSDVITVQKITSPGAVEDAVEAASSYLLSEDASTLRVLVALTYQNAALPYATPYTFEGSPPREELTGPTYRNTFTYYSRELPKPVLTPELRERLIASIQDSARDEAGALPLEDSDAFKAMTKELELAQDDNLTQGEIAIFLTREWLKDDGALLRAEIANAHALIARHAVRDLNSTAVPSLEGQDEVVETMADGRSVVRLGNGVAAGSYISTAQGPIPGTYGNTLAIGRSTAERIEALRTAARVQARAR